MKHILVVDDEPDIRATLREVLERQLGVPVAVDVAASGEEAQRRIREGPAYDLILADERMPPPRGFELLAWAHGACPGARRVLMTAYGDVAPRKGSGPRPDRVLFKPFDARRVLGPLRAELGLEPPMRAP